MIVEIDLVVADLVHRLDVRAAPFRAAAERGASLASLLQSARAADHDDRSRCLCQIADWQRDAEELLTRGTASERPSYR